MRTFLLTLCIATSLPLCACFLSFTSSRAQTCVANFTYTDSNLTVNFTNTSTGAIFNAWNFGDGTFSNQANPIHSFDSSGSYYVCLTVSDGAFCSNTFCDSVTVAGTPGVCTTDFSFTQDSVNPLTLNFSDSSSSGTVSWSWDFGDFSPPSILPNPSHTFPFSGIYNVCLTTTDSASCSDTHCELVDAGNLIPTCQALFVSLDDSANSLVVNFYDISTNANTWEWNFGDGAFSTLQNPVHTYPVTGNYNVCLIIKDTLTGCSDTTCQPVFAGTINTCDAGFTYNVTFTYWFQFSDTSTGNPTGWFWDFGDSITSTNQNPSHLYTANGIYDVCLTITDSTLYCNDYICKTIQIGTCQNPCVADFTFSVSENIATFTNASTGDCTFNTWVFGDGSTDLINSDPIHQYDTSGTFQVCLRRSDVPVIGLCPADTMCKTVVIVPSTGNCVGNFSYTVTGNTVDFTDLSTGNPVSWSWDFGDFSATSALPNPSHTYLFATTYTVCLTIGDGTGCYDTYCASVAVGSASCSAAFTFTTSTLTATFTNNSVAANTPTYSWTFDDGNISSAANPIHPYSNPGSYNVCLTVTDNQAACTDTYCDSITLTNIGFSENSAAMVNVSVIPNPFSVQAVITLTASGNSLNGVQLTISDLLGRDVTPPHIRASDRFVVKRENLTNGMYFYELKNENGVVVKGKLMVE